jgi:ATP-dependent DNA ligase
LARFSIGSRRKSLPLSSSKSNAEACKLGCEGIVSKRLGSIYRRGRSPYWIKVKNPNAPAVKREAEEDW